MRSGTSSHTREVARYVRHYLGVQATELGNFPPVKSAAQVMREVIYNNKGSLSASMICAGWDPYFGAQLYQVNSEGYFHENNICLSGSGSGYIYGLADSEFRANMTRAEANHFVKKMVSHATVRDGSSGGICRVIDIHEAGVTREYIPYHELLAH